MSAKKTRPKAAKPPEVDPLAGSKCALRGRVVSMDAERTVLRDGVVYLDGGVIVDVARASRKPPAGFEDVTVTQTGATLYPGLIELHNHLAYNVLPLWNVPKRFKNRNQWAGTAEYRKLITAPMQILGRDPQMLPALVRYVECKALLGGVTTSQGIQLFSAAGIRRFYRGLVRNVEETSQADLPEALTRIADVEAKSIESFFARQKKSSLMLLHLSEGLDDSARAHFEALRRSNGSWAITPSLCGIHCAGLNTADLGVMAQNGGSMVWSPLSNLLLYGGTANVAAAKSAGIVIGLGSDWSPSGSKNLLGELKAARAWSSLAQPSLFTDAELVAMVTCNAAKILKWDRVLGSLERGKRADLLAIAGSTKDPYAQLLEAREDAVELVVINGVPRLGARAVMKALGVGGESLSVGGNARVLNLKQVDGDPVVGKISLAEARDTLTDVLKRLPTHAKELERRPVTRAAFGLAAGRDEHTWLLALDEIEENAVSLRPELPTASGRPSGPSPVPKAARAFLAQAPSSIVEPVELDKLTFVDDDAFVSKLRSEKNLPAPFLEALVAK